MRSHSMFAPRETTPTEDLSLGLGPGPLARDRAPIRPNAARPLGYPVRPARTPAHEGAAAPGARLIFNVC
jgi:hypothetical protein